jgi:RNA polymerase sigma-70 factor, ECF subfamily
MSVDCCDRALVIRAQSGERGAFNALVHRYRRRVMKLSMRYVRNHADAEDAVQNTFLRAYWGLKQFRGDAAFYTWLHRIAISSAKSVRSVRARNARIFGVDARDHNDEGESANALKDLDTPEGLALTAEIFDTVDAAIEALSDEQQTAIRLCDFHGLSYSQVATEMSCPIGTVRSRVSRAREAIDHQLRMVFEGGLGRAPRNLSLSENREIHLSERANVCLDPNDLRL